MNHEPSILHPTIGAAQLTQQEVSRRQLVADLDEQVMTWSLNPQSLDAEPFTLHTIPYILDHEP
jgi:hypothetical protein